MALMPRRWMRSSTKHHTHHVNRNFNNCNAREVDKNVDNDVNPGWGSGLLPLTAGAPGHEAVRIWLEMERKSYKCKTEDV